MIPIRPTRPERRQDQGQRVILVGVSQSGSDQELLVEEERLWTELHDLIDSMPPDKVEEPGYFEEGWSAKDLVAHIGSWLAEAGVVLERIRSGTYRPEEIDIDAMNETFYDAMHDVAFPDVKAQAFTARNRMLRAWRSLPERSPEADRSDQEVRVPNTTRSISRGSGSGSGNLVRKPADFGKMPDRVAGLPGEPPTMGVMR